MSSYWITVDPKSSDRSLYKRGHTETVRGRDWDGCRPRSPEDCPEPQKAGKKPRKHLPYSVQRQPGPWHLDLWLLVSGTERSHILWFIVICSEAVGTVVVLQYTGSFQWWASSMPSVLCYLELLFWLSPMKPPVQLNELEFHWGIFLIVDVLQLKAYAKIRTHLMPTLRNLRSRF